METPFFNPATLYPESLKKPAKRLLEKAGPWIAAVLVGVAAVGFAYCMRVSESLAAWLTEGHPWVYAWLAPLLFVAAVWVVRRFSPYAVGSGIPQVQWALEHKDHPKALTSARTMVVKIVSALLAAAGGASIGREGPTVQVGASILATAHQGLRRLGIKSNLQALVTVGGAAGVAAAFNTPLAGITFAIEELAMGKLATLRQPLIITVLLAGLTAQGLAGNYAYFGHPTIGALKMEWYVYSLMVGPVMGVLGAGLAWLFLNEPPMLARLSWWKKAALVAFVCWLFATLSDGVTMGSGYAPARSLLDGGKASLPFWYAPGKSLVTVLSFHSGVAGGIFAPVLSIGSGFGSIFAPLFPKLVVTTCALLAMAAFFTGVVQAPLTAVVIVMEMSDQYGMILPLLLSAFCAQAVAQKLMPVPLYRQLAMRMAGEDFTAKGHGA